MAETMELSASSSEAASAAHFAGHEPANDYAADVYGVEGGAGGVASGVSEPNQNLMSQDAFYGFFEGFFAVGYMVNIQSLPIQENEQVAARAASDALYKIIQKHESLHWLLAPGNEMVEAYFALGSFALLKVGVVRMELRAKKQARLMADVPKPEPDNSSENFAFKEGLENG